MTAYAQHHRKLKANVRRTEAIDEMDELLEDIIDCEGIGVIHGDSGVGKSFGLGTLLGAAAQQTDVARAVVRKAPTESRTLKIILEACTGIRVPHGNQFDLFPDVAYELSSHHRLLVLDEAQHMHNIAVETIRHLHDDASTNFSVLLVGGDGCWETLRTHPMLKSRVDGRVHVQPLTLEMVLEHIPLFHPLLGHSDPRLLEYVDSTLTFGNFRAWSSFTRKAVRFAKKAGVDHLTKEIIGNVARTQGGVVERGADEILAELEADTAQAADAADTASAAPASAKPRGAQAKAKPRRAAGAEA